MYNCLDSRNTINNADNWDFRLDHHFSDKNVVFARAYMMWNQNNGIVAGTSSITPSPFHVWNIGGAWDHIFTPNLVLSLRGGINSRPATVNPTNPLGLKPLTDAGYSNLDPTAGFFLNVGGYIGSANNGIGNVGPQLRANPEHNVNASLAWLRGKHNLSFGGSWLYEDRTEINTYETFVSSTTQTCPTNASGSFACGAGQGNGLASMLLDVPSALTVTLPTYSNPHVIMQPFGFFAQDEWHVKPNLTITLGLRYDYDPAVNLSVGNGQTINALDLPGQQYVIGAAQSTAYTTGCGSPQAPPCVPGGLNPNNPAFTVTSGGVTYNTLNNIVFSNSQPALKAIKDNFGPRLGIAWGFAPKTVLRAGYGIFYDPIAYRSQYAENTIQGSIWPFTRGVSATLNNAPAGTAATPTVAPICASAAACGPYGGYGTSYLPSLVGTNPIIVAPTPWGSTLRRLHQRPGLQRPAIAAVELPNRTAVDAHQHGVHRLRRLPHATPRLVLQGQLSAGRPVLPEQPGAGLHLSNHPADAGPDQCPAVFALRRAGLELLGIHRLLHLPRAGGSIPAAPVARPGNAGGLHLGEVPGEYEWRLWRRERLRGQPGRILLRSRSGERSLLLRHSQNLHRDRHLSAPVRARHASPQSRRAFERFSATGRPPTRSWRAAARPSTQPGAAPATSAPRPPQRVACR